MSSEDITNVSTVDLLAELRRRYEVLSRPERSAVFMGAEGEEFANKMNKEFGVCVLDGNKFDLSEISKRLTHHQCRRGFALFGFKQEAAGFDRMLSTDFPDKRVFADYRVFGQKDEKWGNNKNINLLSDWSAIARNLLS